MSAGPESVDSLIESYVEGAVDDATMTAWLRRVCSDGLSDEDTYALTLAMARSGEIVDWRGVDGPIVDKHSTGGVGDDVSLIAVPLAAACGVKVAKLSGRALGHTGGTIDKLECIPGLRTDLSTGEFRSQVTRVGCAIAAASTAIAPADKRLYDLRHRTGTVASIPLIAASIMSKKIAGGAGAMVLDVKSGAGAFMTSVDDARRLAKTMREIGRRAGLRVTTIVTRMDEPIAGSVGDALELDEALKVMEGRGGSPALREAAIVVASAMVRAGGVTDDGVERALSDGGAMARFEALAAAQGGSLAAFDRSWPRGVDLPADRSGFVAAIDARRIGETVARAKGNAAPADSTRFGVRLHRRRGDRVDRGEALMTCWLPEAADGLRDAIAVADAAQASPGLVVEIARSDEWS